METPWLCLCKRHQAVLSGAEIKRTVFWLLCEAWSPREGSKFTKTFEPLVSVSMNRLVRMALRTEDCSSHRNQLYRRHIPVPVYCGYDISEIAAVTQKWVTEHWHDLFVHWSRPCFWVAGCISSNGVPSSRGAGSFGIVAQNWAVTMMHTYLLPLLTPWWCNLAVTGALVRQAEAAWQRGSVGDWDCLEPSKRVCVSLMPIGVCELIWNAICTLRNSSLLCPKMFDSLEKERIRLE